MRRRTRTELPAGSRIAPDVCNRTRVHGRGRCPIRAGKALFENRVGDFIGWISFPLYLVQAAVIYSFSVRGLDVLASFGFEPSMQRWLFGIATVPVALLFAILFCPVNDFAVTLSRRFGSALFGGREVSPYTGPKSRPA